MAGVWSPRQARLAPAMFCLWLASELTYLYGAHFQVILGDIKPDVIVQVLEAPLKAYLMLLDSRYWSSLGVDWNAALGSLDQLSLPLVNTMSSRIRALDWSQVQRIHFTLLRVHGGVLGSGASAQVLEGTWTTHGWSRPVAVKQFSCETITEDTLMESCYEIGIGRLLAGHVNIVELHGYSLCPPYLHIVMEQCESDLHTMLHAREEFHRRLGVGRVELHRSDFCCVALGVAAGVSHVHQCALVHRDLKSPNVLLKVDPNGILVPKLCDFGVTIMAQVCDEEEISHGAFVGSELWAAPEVIAMPRVYSSWSDIFALGLIVLECITQETIEVALAKDAATVLGVHGGLDAIAMYQAGQRPSLEEAQREWGTELCDAVSKAWSMEPLDRGSAQDLVIALDKATGLVGASPNIVVLPGPGRPGRGISAPGLDWTMDMTMASNGLSGSWFG